MENYVLAKLTDAFPTFDIEMNRVAADKAWEYLMLDGTGFIYRLLLFDSMSRDEFDEALPKIIKGVNEQKSIQEV